MNKTTIIYCVLSILLLAYLVFAIRYTTLSAAEDHCTGLQINVIDSVSRGFVTKEDIDSELGDLSGKINNIRRDSINTLDIRNQLMAKDNIENVSCFFLNNGALSINVTPLMPVARVFDTKGGNYYINRDGKRMEASIRYRMDVPVIIGDFNPNRDPSLCFPILDYLTADPDLAQLVSAIEVKKNKDIILVPRIKGHVVNLGDTKDLDNKFQRIEIFYKEVMPVKGWETYDTISVKWRGQVVAHRRHAKAESPTLLKEEHEDIDDEGTMMTLSQPPDPSLLNKSNDKKNDKDQSKVKNKGV